MKDCEKSVRDFVRLFVCLFFGGLAKICLRLFYSSRSGFRKLDQIGIYPGMISDFLFNRLCFNFLFKGAFE